MIADTFRPIVQKDVRDHETPREWAAARQAGGPARRSVIAVVGPTAAVKSDLSLRLAAALDGEVVNADSMLYRGMDIGTGKFTAAERGGVPHHLLDIWDITETASVSEYQRLARAVIGDIQRRGRTAILAGGSGLYVRAAIDNLDFPGTEPALRGRLEAGGGAALGPAALHGKLAAADPPPQPRSCRATAAGSYARSR
jgi:tRNA dimethylallyltransferase